MAARRSTIARLPAELRELIGRLRADGRTIDEILEKLRELDAGVSRSALGRHVKQLDAIAAEIRRSRAVAEAIVARFGEAPESRTASLNLELMHAIVLKLMVSEDGATATLNPQEAMFTATALQRLAAAAKADTEREIRIRREMAAEVGRRIDAVAGEIEGGKTEPAQVLRRIREEVYGILQ